MGVYIRGMEMPISCDSCRIMVLEDTNCDPELFCGCPLVFKAHPQGEDHRPDYCPLIELPPHGRLIVEDDAIETAWMILAGLGYRREENPQLEQAVREVYATAPTIEVE